MDVWQQVKLHYIGLLTNHHQPELAETFFNSVTTKILHRSYFNNDFIFVRPAVSTEYIENDEPAARPPTAPTTRRPTTLRDTLAHGRQLRARAGSRTWTATSTWHSAVRPRWAGSASRPRTNARSRCCPRLFFRNKGAYLVGKIINGFRETAVRAAHPAHHGARHCGRFRAGLGPPRGR
jgi:isocitrate dehydrogenase kinase/phosphatase